MTDGRESANADAEPTHAENISTNPPKNNSSENNNNNNDENISQEQLNQKEKNSENPEVENCASPSNENSGNNNQVNQSTPSQANIYENTEAKSTPQQLSDQNSPGNEKNNELEMTNDKQIENQPPSSISSMTPPANTNNQIVNATDDDNSSKPQSQNNENEQNEPDEPDDKNSQSQNSSTNLANDLGVQNAIDQNQAFLRSFSTNVIPENSNTKNGPPVFHRQISITNSNMPSADSSNQSPIQQHLSVPIMPHYSSSNTDGNNTNSLLSFQYIFQQQQSPLSGGPKPIIPVIANNGIFSSNNPNHKLVSAPNASTVIQTHHHKHHHHHHHHKKNQDQEQQEDDQQEENPSNYQEQTRSPLGISPSDLQELLSKEDDEPELDLTPQTSEAFETFKKTGKLRFSLPASLQAASGTNPNGAQSAPLNPPGNSAESVSYSPSIIRKLQHDKVNAIIKGRYDDAKEAELLSKQVTMAVMESVEEDKRFEKLRQAEWKLEDEKRIFADVHINCIEKVKEEEEALNKRMVALDEIHEAEMRQFEEKWNNEDFLRRFSKPSSSLLQLKAVERSMVIAKMFDEAKVVKSRAEQREKFETRNQQNRAEQEMKVERSRLIERQKKEKQGLKEKCDNLLIIAKKNMEKEEMPYKARISRLESIVAELKSGAESKGKIVPSKVQSSLVSPRGHGKELFTARTAFKFSAYKVTSQSMKLKIKPLGSVTIKEKKKSKTTKK